MYKIFAVLCTVLLFSPLLHAKSIEAGYVQEIVGSPTHYILERQGKKRPLMLLDVVYAKDKIFIAESARTEIRLVLSLDHKAIDLESDSSPYVVPKPKKASSVASNLMAMLSKSITSMHQRYTQTVVSAISRGSRKKQTHATLAFSNLFLHANNKLHAQQWPLVVQWLGGTKPYHIQLLKDGHIIQKMDSDKKTTVMENQLFEKGYYEIKVSDSTKASISSQFQIVTDALPTMPDNLAQELTQSQLSTEMNNALRMAWLVKLYPQWQWEAYQQLCPAKKAYVAKVLCTNFLLGN